MTEMTPDRAMMKITGYVTNLENPKEKSHELKSAL
jgi:hypothetical protein